MKSGGKGDAEYFSAGGFVIRGVDCPVVFCRGGGRGLVTGFAVGLRYLFILTGDPVRLRGGGRGATPIVCP